MGDKTGIEWTDSTWSPVTGCTKVSSGCRACYAERVSKRMGVEFTKVTLHPERLEQPLHWQKPRRIFVCSMSDLFHEDVPDTFLLDAFRMMEYAMQHTYQILTKRPERMRQFMECAYVVLATSNPDLPELPWPLPNIWLGVSCENKAQLSRLDLLRQIPAAVRFVSFEPLLEALGKVNLDGIHWCIVGGESGGSPERALVFRAYHADGSTWKWLPKPEALKWLRSIRDQCQAAGVPFFFKQWGGPRAKSGGRMLDGRTWDEYPEVRR